MLLVMWESGCPVCESELKALASFGAAEVIALAADGIETAGEAYEVIEDSGFNGEWGFIDPRSLETLDRWGAALFDRVPEPDVPLGLLLDSRGHCVAIYRGAVDPELLAADVEKLVGLDPRTRWHFAPPMPGTWFTNPPAGAFVRQLLLQ